MLRYKQIIAKIIIQSVNNLLINFLHSLTNIDYHHMKSISNRVNSYQNKENFNFLNRYISPNPSRKIKGESYQISSQSKMFMSGVQGNLCSTQDGRHATHFFMDQDEQILKYCQKCAIILASKGFNVQKLHKTPMSQRSNITESVMNSTRKLKKQILLTRGSSIKQRLSKVQELKDEIKLCEKQLQSRQTQVESLLIESGDMYSGLISQVSSYFKIIQHLVEYQKYLAYNKVLTERVNNQKQLRVYKQTLAQLKQTIIHIKQDLMENQDVVLTVTSQQFDSILENYHSTVNTVPQTLNNQPQIQPIYSLTLPPVPQILDQLADQMIFVKQSNEVHQQQSFFKDLRNIVGFSNQQQRNLSSKRDKSPILHLNLNSLEQMRQSQQSINDDNSETVSQHSFSMKSAFQRDAHNMNKNSQCTKQIMLQNSFSVASSIVNNECISSEQQHEDHVSGSYEPERFHRKGGIDYLQLPKWRSGLNRMEQSLGKYLMGDDTMNLNQTEHDRSQTLLLYQ